MQASSIGSLALMLAVGLSLGAVGGGGSVLVLPILVYLAGLPATKAVGMALAVVCGTSLLGAFLHTREGHVHWKAALLFGLPGVVSSAAASRLTKLVSDQVLMGIFAGVAVAAGAAMWMGRGRGSGATRCRAWRCLAAGAGTGALTGFLGVGGGFLIVPSLVLLGGVATKDAVGTSLWVITANAASGFVAHVRGTSLAWGFTAGLTATAVVGMLAGVWLSGQVRPVALKKSLAVVVIAAGLAVGVLSATGRTLSG